jgi:hypothetical protein
MARHNRDARGTDQRGYDYEISYQPDWVRLIKVTRTLESGRQSTKTLFKNPAQREQSPGSRVRTRVECKSRTSPSRWSWTIPTVWLCASSWLPNQSRSSGESLEFTIDDRLGTATDE